MSLLEKTRQVYNRPRTSNLSQQQQEKVWSKMISEQQNYGKNEIWEKSFRKKFDFFSNFK